MVNLKGKSAMKQLIQVAAGLALIVCGAPRVCADAFLDEGGWEYTHTSNRGNKCTFVVGNKDRRGTANYVWNGQRVREQLEYEKGFRENDVSYWVYKVINKDRWFVLAQEPVKNKGKDDYRIFYSNHSPKQLEDCTLTTTNVTSLKKLEKLQK
jgi:hypothetical protein